MVNAFYCSWTTVTSGVLQGYVLFNIFISDPEEVTHQPVGRVLPEGRAAIQRGRGRLEEWAYRSIMDLGREGPCQ